MATWTKVVTESSSGNIGQNAATATALASAGTITFTGDVTGGSTPTYTGGGNLSIAMGIAANSVDGTHIALGSDASGDIMYYDGTNYVRLAKGSANQVLQMGGSNIPEWGAVAATEIAAGAVGTSELAADAVDGTKIADDAINSEHYTDGSIDTAHIADDQVTLAKMAGLARGKIIYGDASGNPAALTIGTNGQALKSDGTDLVWGSAGGGATATNAFTNQSSTTYAGTGSSGTGIDVNTTVATEASGAGEREIFIKKIDTNNEGVFAIIHKNGKAVEVQIA